MFFLFFVCNDELMLFVVGIKNCIWILMEILLTVGWSIKCDVYSYGCVLLSLIAKRVVDKKQPSGTYVDTWAKKQYQQKKEKLSVGNLKKVVPKCSLVHKSLEEDPLFLACDGLIITDLAMSCVEFEPAKRPTMNEVVQKLRALRAVKRRGKAYFGFRQGV